jgi:hypothetical protein
MGGEERVLTEEAEHYDGKDKSQKIERSADRKISPQAE